MHSADGFHAEELVVLVALQAAVASCGFDHGVDHGAEFAVVGDGVAVHGTGTHELFRHKTVAFHAVEKVAKATSLSEANVAVGADGCHGTVHVVPVGGVHFAKIVGSFSHAKQFGFDEGHAAVVPAGAGLALVFDGGDRQFFGDIELVPLVGFVFLMR